MGRPPKNAVKPEAGQKRKAEDDAAAPEGAAPAKSDAKPPKRARTAYLVFCDRYRAQIMKAVHPETGAKFTREEMQSVTTRLADLWKNVTPKELEECKQEAAVMKAEYEKAKSEYVPTGPTKKGKGKKGKNATILVAGQGEKPKRARTAYLIFCDRYRAQIMKDVHGEEGTKFTREEMQQVTTRLADMWKNISEAELNQCKAEADSCKEEYQKKKESYVPPVYAKDTKGKKAKGKEAKKESDKPKRPPTAYLLFADDCRNRLKKSQPTLKFAEVSVIVGKEWKALTEAQRNKYKKKAGNELNKAKAKKEAAAKKAAAAAVASGMPVAVAGMPTAPGVAIAAPPTNMLPGV